MGAWSPLFFMRAQHEPNKRDFSHYSQELQDALHHFQEVYLTYMNIPTWRMRDNPQRGEVVQSAWNQFVRLRKAETGFAYYTSASETK